MWLWLDDLRPPKDGYNLVARNAPDAIWLMLHHPVTQISFDHDLGVRDPEEWSWLSRWQVAEALTEADVQRELRAAWSNLPRADCGNGVDVAKFIMLSAQDWNRPPMRWSIHSANPIGERNICQTMRDADVIWNQIA